MKKLFLLVLISTLSSCEYTTQLCDLEHRVDVAGLDRPLTLVAPNDKFQVERQSTQLKRIGKGAYEGSAFTCAYNGKILLESKNDYGNWSAQIINETPKTFNLTITAFDKRQLDSYQIPYRIERRKSNGLFPLILSANNIESNEETTTEQLVVDNSHTSADLIVELLQNTSFSLNLYK
jgi:hypothetical protein